MGKRSLRRLVKSVSAESLDGNALNLRPIACDDFGSGRNERAALKIFGKYLLDVGDLATRFGHNKGPRADRRAGVGKPARGSHR